MPLVTDFRRGKIFLPKMRRALFRYPYASRKKRDQYRKVRRVLADYG